VGTLLIYKTLDNMLDVGKELLLDVLLVQEIWNSTNNGTHVCMMEFTKQNHQTNIKFNDFIFFFLFLF